MGNTLRQRNRVVTQIVDDEFVDNGGRFQLNSPVSGTERVVIRKEIVWSEGISYRRSVIRPRHP